MRAGLEVPTSTAISPNSVNVSVTISVTELNDPPLIFYLPGIAACIPLSVTVSGCVRQFVFPTFPLVFFCLPACLSACLCVCLSICPAD